MDKLVIDRTKWYRGKGSRGSALLRKDGSMCCLGFDLLRRGFTPEQILEVGTPEEVEVGGEHPEIAGLTYVSSDWEYDIYATTETNEELVDANDGEGLSEAEREAQIIDLFAEIDVEVVFVG